MVYSQAVSEGFNGLCSCSRWHPPQYSFLQKVWLHLSSELLASFKSEGVLHALMGFEPRQSSMPSWDTFTPASSKK